MNNALLATGCVCWWTVALGSSTCVNATFWSWSARPRNDAPRFRCRLKGQPRKLDAAHVTVISGAIAAKWTADFLVTETRDHGPGHLFSAGVLFFKYCRAVCSGGQRRDSIMICHSCLHSSLSEGICISKWRCLSLQPS